jgi:hypothetical protein
MKELTEKQGFVVFVDNDYTAHVFIENKEKFYSWLEEEIDFNLDHIPMIPPPIQIPI